ncbi:MAG: hypothetical protein KA118_19360 [Verrucomicrobia bacterium]|nr:hypothetical protein [Verrucomicrobiota bacterium]
MKSTRSLLPLLLAVLAPLASGAAPAAAPADLSRVMPFTDEFTVMAARLDLGTIDAAAWASAVLDLLPEQRQTMAEPVQQAQQAVQPWLEEFRKAGGHVVYLVISLSDLGPEAPAFAVVPLADNSDPARLAALLRQTGIHANLNTTVQQGCLVAAIEPVLERIRALKPADLGHLESAFAAARPGVLQAALLPYQDAGRIIEELMPALPSMLGGGSSSTLTRGLQWATLSIQQPPEWSVELAIRSTTAADAEALHQWLVRVWTAWGSIDEIKSHLPRWDELGAALEPAVDGDTLRIRLDRTQIGELVRTIMLPVLQESKNKAAQAMILNKPTP